MLKRAFREKFRLLEVWLELGLLGAEIIRKSISSTGELPVPSECAFEPSDFKIHFIVNALKQIDSSTNKRPSLVAARSDQFLTLWTT